MEVTDVKFLKWIIDEKCPHCKNKLDSSKTFSFVGKISKYCSSCSYRKEFHPGLQTVVETTKK